MLLARDDAAGRKADAAMFDAFRKFVSALSDGETHPSRFADNDYRLAAAALLVHAAAIDGDISDIERDRLHAVIKRRFDLDEAATDELVGEATEAEQEAVDLYHFTSLLNRSLDEDGRRRIVEMMWEIVYADGRVTEFEDNLIWRAADLLGRVLARTRRIAPARCRQSRDRRLMRPVTLITGASAGIGAALAHVFAAHGHELVLIARRERELGVLADAIAAGGHPRPTVLPADLERPEAVERIDEALRAHGLEPDIVVNNAGFGLLGRAAGARPGRAARHDRPQRARADRSVARLHRQPRTPQGRHPQRGLGRGLPAGPGMAVYYASKAYVLSFSEALHRELEPRGVRVTALCPGPVPTEFQARAGVPVENSPHLLTRSAADVAQAGYRGLKAGRRLVVPGLLNKVVVTLLPRGCWPRIRPAPAPTAGGGWRRHGGR